MSAYIIVDISVHDPEQYQQYVNAAPDFVAKHQGRYIVRGGAVSVAEGDWQPERLVIVKFPSRQRAEAFLADPAYQAIAATRHASTTSKLLIADGFEPA